MLYAQLILGIALLLGGGEILVRGAVGVARRLGVSPLIIGVTLVGFGTSTPELAASIDAARIGAMGIVIGSVVGSNIANVLLILGVTALISPVVCDPRAFKRDGTVLAAVTLAFIGVVLWVDRAGIEIGLPFAAALVAYVALTYWHDRRNQDAAAALHAQEAELAGAISLHPALGLLFVGGGIAAVIFGARLLVDGAVTLAAAAGVPDTVIGLSVVAIGTSLPELATCAMAARKGEGDIALGNVLGSNIYNVLGVFGITALVEPITIPAEARGAEILVLGIATAAMLLFAMTGWRFTRTEGAICVLGYGAFIGLVLV